MRTYVDPVGDNEFVVDGWCECNAGSSKPHRHLGRSPWTVVKDGCGFDHVYQLCDGYGGKTVDELCFHGGVGDVELRTLFILGLRAKYGEEAVRHA